MSLELAYTSPHHDWHRQLTPPPPATTRALEASGCSSVWLEYRARNSGAAGSNPATQTNLLNKCPRGEMADALSLDLSAFGRVGSSPTAGTNSTIGSTLSGSSCRTKR